MIPQAPKNPLAVVAITKNGRNLAHALQMKLKEVDVYISSKLAKGDEQEHGMILYAQSTRELLQQIFKRYRGVILLFSLGAGVRMLASLLEDKKKDPCVVVVDNGGRFAISVLSGHLGGGNELTIKVANAIGAIPVITTASDVQETLAVDLLGREFGWELEDSQHMTAVSAAVVNEDPVAIVQESGERNWWKYDSDLPCNLTCFSFLEGATKGEASTAIIISHRILPEISYFKKVVVYRPKVIVLGIGCNRGTSADEIEQVIDETLEQLLLSKKSVKAIASIDLKKDEEGLIKVTNKNRWIFHTYSAKELNQVPVSKRSETVYQYTGAYGVSEPAAKRYSMNDECLLTKKKSGNVTISVALIEHRLGKE
ncbi:cobalt-precorrin 5A hydrolase [Robertmurraya sp. P23]|uniref:cobalt-precorrin 5A hydrolase n=1 Tax=Robertmurraya sp. P23 TaxID=3436931 RepID=UPI003D97660D